MDPREGSSEGEQLWVVREAEWGQAGLRLGAGTRGV